MSDDPTPDLEPEVETPEAETPDQPEDLGALKRALEREREERKQAKDELRRWREDEDWRREQLSELGYEFADTDDDEEPDDDDELSGRDPEQDRLAERLAAIEADRAVERADRAVERFNRDLKEIADGRSVSEQAKVWISQQTHEGGDDRSALEKSVKAWFDYEDQLRSEGVEQLRESKKAPRTPVRGTQATEVPDLDDRNERRKYMLERAQTLGSQQ